MHGAKRVGFSSSVTMIVLSFQWSLQGGSITYIFGHNRDFLP